MITVLGKPLRGPSVGVRLLFLLAASGALMVLDQRGQELARIRAALMTLVYPLQAVAAAPLQLYREIADGFASERALKAENQTLQDEHTQLQARLQQFEALEAENQRLRDMLGSSARVSARAVTAELIEVSLEPFTRRLIVARGAEHGVYVGQPVIDAYGILGQVTTLSPRTATITLITDPSHAIPALLSRNGLRVMVFGSGDPDSVSIPYLTATTDIREGDILVSSGIGGTFPAGYPVASVTRIENDPNESFLAIAARPTARLNHDTQVLLIWPEATPSSRRAETPRALPGDKK